LTQTKARLLQNELQFVQCHSDLGLYFRPVEMCGKQHVFNGFLTVIHWNVQFTALFSFTSN